MGSTPNSSVTAPMARNAAPDHRVVSDGYLFQTVDYAGSNNEITGMNSSGDIVGNYANSSGSNAHWNSYVAQEPYNSFQPISYPTAVTTYMYAISDRPQPVEVGYVAGFNGESGTWGVVDNQGLWNLIARSVHELQCQQPIHELLGFDSNTRNAVGLYSNFLSGSSCQIEAYEVKPGDNRNPYPIKPNWTTSWASGIASNGTVEEVVGTRTLSGSPTAGWLLVGSTYTVYNCCGASGTNPTTFNGITITGSPPNVMIVGSYTVGSKTHGFLFNQTTKVWTAPIDEPSAHNLTVINCINALTNICGWYDSSNGNYHGFVGLVAAASPKRHKNRLPITVKSLPQ